MASNHLVPLSEVCESIDYGLTASAKDHPTSYKFLRITDIVSGHLDWGTVPYVDPSDAKLDRYTLHHGDIVVARTGATTGHSAYIRHPPPCLFASYLVRLKVRTGVDARYVAYTLKAPAFADFIRAVTGDKSAQPNASATTMTKALIRLPPLHEQQAIASILGALDDKIELNRQMNQTLEEMAQAIFKSWFVDFEGHTEFEESEVGRIPKGWRPGSLGDVIDLHDSKRVPLSSLERDKRRGPYPYYGAASVMDHVDDYLFDGVFVLMGEDGSVIDDAGYPIVQYVWGRFWVNNHAHVLTGRGAFSQEQLLLFLRQCTIRPFVTGAVQPKPNQKNLRSIPLCVPPDSVCGAFEDIVQPLFARLRANSDETETLAEIRDTLLPKLISGEIRVPEAEKLVENVA